jgi:hypothetical protein
MQLGIVILPSVTLLNLAAPQIIYKIFPRLKKKLFLFSSKKERPTLAFCSMEFGIVILPSVTLLNVAALQIIYKIFPRLKKKEFVSFFLRNSEDLL